MPGFTEHKANLLSSAIIEKLEDNSDYYSDKEKGFLEDMSHKVTRDLSLTQNQYNWLLDLIGNDWL